LQLQSPSVFEKLSEKAKQLMTAYAAPCSFTNHRAAGCTTFYRHIWLQEMVQCAKACLVDLAKHSQLSRCLLS
jgi:hypothetical protein